MDDFDFVAFAEHVFTMPAFRHDAPVHFDSDAALCIAMLFKELRQADGAGQVEYLAIE